MALSTKTQIREHVSTFFSLFKLPVDFEIPDLPLLWQKQRMEKKYSVRLAVSAEGYLEFRSAKSETPEESERNSRKGVPSP